jgi:photosystem II stability/assembly factor-like uncharacterized protein
LFEGRPIRICSTFFLSPTEGWGVGFLDKKGRGTISKTSDGGASWSLVYTVPEANSTVLRDVYFINESLGCAVGSSRTRFGFEGSVWCTADSGKTWGHKYAVGRGPSELVRISKGSAEEEL